MRNAVILDYADGDIVILPIPEDVLPEHEDSFVRMHPAYDSDTCSYMVIDGAIDIYKVSTEESAHKEDGMVCHESRPVHDMIYTIEEL